MSHTPGPWAVDIGDVDVGPRGGFMPFGGCGCCGSPWMTASDHETAQADARLIAAAPDMLEVCKAVADWDGPQTAAMPARGILAAWDNMVAAARAAIAKAEQG